MFSMTEFNLDLNGNTRLSNVSFEGYIYILRAHGDYYKIGMTNLPRRRISSLRAGLPEEPQSIEVFWVGDTRMEFDLHEMFPSKRLRGEWFEFTQSQVEQIRNHILAQGGEFANVL